MAIKRAHDLEPKSDLERDLIALLHRHGFGITSFELEENNIDTGIPKVRFGRIHVTMERDATDEEAGRAATLRAIAGQSPFTDLVFVRDDGPLTYQPSEPLPYMTITRPVTVPIQTEAQFEIRCECGGTCSGSAVLEGSVDRHIFEGVQCSGCERTYTVEVNRD